jgi:hypothetical protein
MEDKLGFPIEELLSSSMKVVTWLYQGLESGSRSHINNHVSFHVGQFQRQQMIAYAL